MQKRIQCRGVSNKNSRRATRRRAVIGAALLAAIPTLTTVVHAGPITFGTPQNISGDTDVFNVGSTAYAFNWNGSASTVTVNGVTFTGTTAIATTSDGNVGLTTTTTAGGLSGVITNATNAFAKAGNPFGQFDPAYQAMLLGGDYYNVSSGTAPFTVSLNNLSLNHEYALQIWDNDARPKAGRYATITSVGGNSQNLQYSVANVAGSPGQYSIGGFTATAGNQLFTITGNSDTQINALQVRDVTGVWSGQTNGNWDNSTANFTAGESFSTVASLGINTIYFADTDGFDNPVTNSTVTIQSGGVTTGTLVFQNNAVSYSVISSDANGISGSTALLKTGSGLLTLSGANTYSGGTTLNAGITQFNAGAVPSTGVITINSAASLNATGAYPTVTGWLGSGKIAATSAGDIALTGNSSESINFSGYPTLMLGATANSNFTGTLTPAGTTYRLGGGGASLTISGTNTLTGNNSLVVGAAGSTGAVILASSNSYTGGTTLVAGSLTVGPVGTLGSNTSGNNVSVAAGLNLLLSAASNIGASQQMTINSTASAVGGIGIAYDASTLPTFKNTGSYGGVFGINYTGTGGVISMSTLDSALDTGGATGHWFLGSQTNGVFNGATLAAASDKNYRLGGGGGVLTITGTNVLTGANSLVIGQASTNGAGTVILEGSQSFTGTTTLNAGVLNISSDASLGTPPSAPANDVIFSGSASLQAGAASVNLNANRNVSIGNSSTAAFDTNGNAITINGNITGSTGSINVVGGGAITLNGTESYTGLTSVTSGTLTYGTASASGASSNTLYGLSVGTGSGSGLVNINTNGTLYFGNTTVGSVTGAGAVVQNSGTVNLYPSGNYVNVGSGGYGSYTLGGGTLNTPNSTGIKVGFGGPGLYTQTSGSLVESRYFIVGTQSNSGSGVATFTGGTAAITNGSYEIIVGDAAAATGVLNVGTEAGGNALITTGSSPLGIQVTDNLETNGSATLNLNPGTVNIQGGAITKGGSVGSTATVNLNGVMLQAGLLGSLLIDNTLNSVNVYNGGLIVDTQGNNTAITANLSRTTGDGIYANNGNGILAVSTNGGSGYIGSPLVSVTGGTGNGAMAVANVSNGSITGVTLTNPGQGYHAGDTISFTFSGGGASTSAQTFQYTLTSSDVAPNVLGGLTKINVGTLTLFGVNTYSGPTTVSGGSVVLAAAGSLPSGTNLSIAAGASVVANNLGTPVALSVGSLAVAGKLDLNNNSLVVHSSTLAAVTSLVQSGYNNGGWNGNVGIVSSTAADDGTELTALGVITNDNGSGQPLYGTGGSINSTFDGTSPVDGDVLVKYTYYGDTSLKGYVDGTDYSRIDNAYVANQSHPNEYTGWFNGDFNYDGVIDGSDYTLVDNAFNTQGASLSAQIATSTAQIAGPAGSSSVPEPASLGFLAIGTVTLLGRRNHRCRRWHG